MHGSPQVRVAGVLAALLAFSSALFAQQPPLDEEVEKARAEVARYEDLAKKLEAGDKDTARKYLAALDAVGKTLGAAKDKRHPLWVDAARRYNALRKSIADTANKPGKPKPYQRELEQLNRDVLNAAREFQLRTRRGFQRLKDEKNVQSWRDRIGKLYLRLAELPPEDGTVKLIGENIGKIEQMLSNGLEQLARDGQARAAKAADAKKAQARAAQIKQQIDAIAADYRREGMPTFLREPLDAAGAGRWAKSAHDLLKISIPRDVAKLDELGRDPNADKQQYRRVRHWIGSDWPRNLKEMIHRATELVDGKVGTGLGYADFLMTTDISDESQVITRLLGKGSFDQNMENLQKGLEAVGIARAFDAGLKREGGPDRDAEQKRLEDAVKTLRELAVAALDKVRMPPSRSTDPKLLATAKKVLARPKYEVGAYKRMVISYDVHRKEKREAWVDPGTVRTQVSFYHYVWDEYAVTTAEKVGDEWYLFYNKLKYYHSGDTKTPTDEWVLADRFQSTRILEEYIDE